MLAPAGPLARAEAVVTARRTVSPALAAILVLVALLGLLLAPSACKKGGDPVREAIDGIARGAEERDAGEIADRISESFRDAGGTGKAETVATVKRYLAAYESLGVSLSSVAVERGPDRARATFEAELSGTPSKAFGLDAVLPRSSAWRFEVRLALEEGSRWRLVEASWERLR